MLHGIKECACIGVPDKIVGLVPKLFVVINEDTKFSQKVIIEFLKTKLNTDKLPQFIEEIDSIPRVGTSYKIDRKTLKKVKQDNEI
jgi:acyl-coenzyme A synthetase/AMP-(fatty) acid ligase